MEELTKQTVKQLHGAVASYKMPEQAKVLIGSGEVIILCGVTAAGKNTISNYLVENGDYAQVVSHTTRLPRVNNGVPEQNGVEYWFVNDEQMLQMVLDQKFVEVKNIHDQQISGTSIAAIESIIMSGKHPVMEIDIQGTIELTNIVPDLRPLFVLPPSFEVWMERLNKRGAVSEAEKERRLRSASMEIQTALDHPAFLLTVNHEVELTAAEIMNGLDYSEATQEEHRRLALELLDIIKNI